LQPAGSSGRAIGLWRVVPGVLLVVGAALAVFASASAAAPKTGVRLRLYSLTTEEQFLNHADDRQRGFGNNPFGNFHAPTATTREQNNGPFPGDNALFTFNLYTSQSRKHLVGTAAFTCTYNFDKNGYCDATYQLGGGLLVGAGAIDFNAKNYTLIITGGTGKYRAATGTVESVQAAYSLTRLTITLT